MQRAAGTVKKTVIIACLLLLSGCANYGFNYLPTEPDVRYAPTKSVHVFWEKPDLHYEEIGLITVEKADTTWEELYNILVEKAQSVGAEGLIIRLRGKDITPEIVYGVSKPLVLFRIEAMAIRYDEDEWRCI